MNDLRIKIDDLDVGKLKNVPIVLKLCSAWGRFEKDSVQHTKYWSKSFRQKSSWFIYLNSKSLWNTDKQNFLKTGNVKNKIPDITG